MPDYNSQQQSLNRRRQMAQALQQESMLPIEMPQYPGANVSWTQGAAKLAQALFAGLQNRKLDKQQAALDEQTTAERQAQIAALAQAMGRPDLAPALSGEFGKEILADALAGNRQAESNEAAMARVLAGQTPPAPRNIDPLSPQGIAATVERDKQLQGLKPPEAIPVRNIDPLSAEGIAAAVEKEKQLQGLKPQETMTPVPGRDIPLPADVEAQRIRMSATRASQGRPVISGDANRIADYDTSLNDLATLKKELTGMGATGTAAKAGAMLPNAITEATGIGMEAKKKQAVIDRVKQVIGKALEGGVLRKEDEYKYEKILPTIADPPAIVESKLSGLESAITQRRVTTLDALQDAGFDVTRYKARTNAAPNLKSMSTDDLLKELLK